MDMFVSLLCFLTLVASGNAFATRWIGSGVTTWTKVSKHTTIKSSSTTCLFSKVLEPGDAWSDDEEFKKFAAQQVPGFIPTGTVFNPDEIKEESFAGFLKAEYIKMTGDVRTDLSFNQFYQWRSATGSVLTSDEMHDLWEALLEERYVPDRDQGAADLEFFIQINNIIDEM